MGVKRDYSYIKEQTASDFLWIVNLNFKRETWIFSKNQLLVIYFCNFQ